MPQSKTFGRLLRMAVNGIAAYEGKHAPAIEDELGQQIGLSAAAIQRYKAGHLPPEPRTVQLLAAAAVQRGHLDRAWLAEFLDAAAHPAPRAILDELFPVPPAMPVPIAPAPVAMPTDRNRARMLEKVHSFWISGVLEQSLHGAVLLELGLVEQPDAVARPWDVVVQQPERPPRPLPPDRPILTVFEELGGALLILGAPGAGKTTMLLELARDLLARARADAAAPIPVVLNLSTWDGRHPELAAWLLDELQLRYQVPERIGRAWLAEARLIPLLDGLDEVGPERREACVAAINRFHQQHGLHGLVVASRVGDYELLANRLQLQGAVLIQPLSQGQIDRYLDAAGPALVGLRQSLHADAGLRELADAPLMLSIMSLACQGEGAPFDEAPHSLEERRRQIFTRYVERMFTRRAASTAYAPAQVRRWLGWLALQMRRHGQSVFAIEGLQPSWLPGPRERLGFTVLAGATMGLLAFVLLMVGFAAMRSVSVLLGVWSWRAEPGQVAALWTALVGLVLLFGGIGLGVVARGRAAARAALGLCGGGMALVLLVQPVWIGGDGATWLWALLALLSTLLGATVSFVGGLTRWRRGHDSGERTIRVVETLRWSPRRALRAGVEGLLAGQMFGLVWLLIIRPLATPELTALARLIPPLVGGMALGALACLVGGLVGGEVERRTAPNQGIGQSARHTLRAILAGPLLALILGPILVGGALLFALVADADQFFAALGGGVGAPVSVGLSNAMFLLLAAPLLGALVGLASGVVACLQHLILRVLLWQDGAAPWDYARFLDYAAERLFLRKVGGSYIFVHRLLLEHLAETDGAAWAERLALPERSPETIRLGPRAAVPAVVERRRWLGPLRGAPHERPVRARVLGLTATISTTVLATAALTLALVVYTPAPALVQTLEGPRELRGVSFADNGTAVVAASVDAGSLLRWQIGQDSSAQIIGTEDDDLRSYGMSVAPNGMLFAGVRGWPEQVELRRGSDGTLLHTVAGYLPTFAPDGQTLATVVRSGEVRLWDAASGEELGRQTFDGGYIAALAFSDDSRTLAIGGANNRVWFWQPGSAFASWSIAITTEEQPGVERDTRTYPYASMAMLSAVALSPDGETVAVALSDGRIQLWRSADGQLLGTLAGHTGYVSALAFSPDGATLASGAQDRTVRLWRVADAAPLANLRGHLASVVSVAFAPDGQTLASGSVDHTVRLWRVRQ